eukprot:scaffold21965_cov64-Phaeocystis_antarctica.AAC.2
MVRASEPPPPRRSHRPGAHSSCQENMNCRTSSADSGARKRPHNASTSGVRSRPSGCCVVKKAGTAMRVPEASGSTTC